jgi:chromosome segregation ATPase
MSGFVDLRLNRQEGQVNESFWPSFTDIMTVVMMIFLIAMVVLLMRNMELVNELRNTMEAEQQAAQKAAQTGAANQTLSLKLSEAQARIEQLQQQLAAAQARQQQDQETITGQQDEMATLMTERNDMAEQLALANIALDKQHKQMADDQQKLANLEARLANAMSQRDDLDSQLTQANQALADAERDQQSHQQQYSDLVGKYDQLRVKYDKLVRPARSPQGHFLVEIRYTKRKGLKLIDFREGGSGEFTRLDRATLSQRLALLKRGHSEGLYLKIIIPEDSGLSYTEAWSFTRDLLAQYDYYYEGQAGELPPDH